MSKLNFAALRGKLDQIMWRRIWMALVGVVICSFSVGFYRLSDFGTDPYQCLAAGVDNLVPLSFGNVLTIMNCILLVVVLFVRRRYVGIATIFTVFLTGYIVDFSVWVLESLNIEMTMPVRIAYLIIGVVVMCFASSLYITSDLGVSSYDAQALMLSDNGKAPFRFVRIGTDLVCVVCGFLMGAKVGVGTLVAAFFMGPLIDFFNVHVARPFLNRPVKAK